MAAWTSSALDTGSELRRKAHAVFHGGLEVTQLRAAVEAPAWQAHGEHALVRQQLRDGVGELDFPSSAGRQLAEQLEDARRQHIAADDRESRRRFGRPGLLDDAVDAGDVGAGALDGHDTVALRLVAGHFLDAEERGAFARKNLRHARHGRRLRVHQVVGEDHRERVVADDRPGAQHRVAQAERLGLADIDAARALGQHRADHVEQHALVLALELGLQLVGLVEVVLDRALVAAGHEDHLGDSRRRLLDRVLDQRLVDDRQHLLRARLGHRQKAAAEPRDREYRFSQLGVHQVLVSSSRNLFSSSTVTPRLRALSSLLPASSPATTKSVFFDTDPATLWPFASSAARASSRVIDDRLPVSTNVRPSAAGRAPACFTSIASARRRMTSRLCRSWRNFSMLSINSGPMPSSGTGWRGSPRFFRCALTLRAASLSAAAVAQSASRKASSEPKWRARILATSSPTPGMPRA